MNGHLLLFLPVCVCACVCVMEGGCVSCVRTHATFIQLSSDRCHQLRHRGGGACYVGGACVYHGGAALHAEHDPVAHRNTGRRKKQELSSHYEITDVVIHVYSPPVCTAWK